MPTILIADDEKNIRSTLARGLRLEGYATLEAQNGIEALERIASEEIDAVILDLQMPLLDGQGVLEQLQQRGDRTPVIMLTAHGSIERAVQAVKSGAFDFVEKPPSIDRLLLALEKGLRFARLNQENQTLRAETGRDAGLLGSSPAMQQLRALIEQAAPTQATVLLLGENGSGKEVVARSIVERSSRRARPFVTVNCAAIPETLFEAELFGHTKGAFTGAGNAKRGRFQSASGGTLMLDEIGELPLALQAKLLRALESGEVERVGAESVEKVDVRVIAATNRDLEQAVAAGRFRADLFFRLNVLPIRVPALREHRDDIPLLAHHFLEQACRRHRLRPKRIEPAALDRLISYDWPGNVRELRNAIERLAILSREDAIGSDAAATVCAGAAAAPSQALAPAGPFDLAARVEELERSLVLQVLERCRWQMTKAAEELGLERSHLYKKLKALGIEK